MSQLKITLDAGYCFDLMSIAEIKSYRMDDLEKRKIVIKSIENLWNELEKQMGFNKLLLIYQSKEYGNLYDVNNKTWDAVEKAERNEISAKEVSDLNTLRYYHKKKLQEKYFNSTLSEQKASS